MTRGMREKNNAIAEKLWYVIKEAVEAGVTVDDFRRESRDCWIETHREAAETAAKQFDRELR